MKHLASNLCYEDDFVKLIENLRDWIVDLTNFARRYTQGGSGSCCKDK